MVPMCMTCDMEFRREGELGILELELCMPCATMRVLRPKLMSFERTTSTLVFCVFLECFYLLSENYTSENSLQTKF